MPAKPESKKRDMRAVVENFSQKFDKLLDMLICKDPSTYERNYKSCPHPDLIKEINTCLNEGSFFLYPGKPKQGKLYNEKFYMLAFIPYFKKPSAVNTGGMRARVAQEIILQEDLYFPALFITETTKLFVAKAVGESYEKRKNNGMWLDLDSKTVRDGYFSKLYPVAYFSEKSEEDEPDFETRKEKIKKQVKAQLATVFLEFAASLEDFSSSLDEKQQRVITFGEKAPKRVSVVEYTRCVREIKEFSAAFDSYLADQEAKTPAPTAHLEKTSAQPAMDAGTSSNERQYYYSRIVESMKDSSFILDEDGAFLKRFHISLQTRKFVILAGVSGTGKTRLALEYARAVRRVEKGLAPASAGAGAQTAPALSPALPDPAPWDQEGGDRLPGDVENCFLKAVAPNWTSNDDLLGYCNPLNNDAFVPTAVWEFIKKAQAAEDEARKNNMESPKFFLILDEMNLARVEHYFAAFLSAMELRSYGTSGYEACRGTESGFRLPDNLYCIGTVNIDETTHDFSDKVYDRAQLLEMPLDRGLLEKYFERPEWKKYKSPPDVPNWDIPETLLEIWDAVYKVAPFGFRVLDEILAYLDLSEDISPGQLGTALDVCVLQKILPKIRGGENIENVLEELYNVLTKRVLNQSKDKVARMKNAAREGYVTFFTCGL